MNDTLTEPAAPPTSGAADYDNCAICGAAAGQRAFCRLFNGEGRIVLCSPSCLSKFIRRDEAAERRDVATPYWSSSFS